MQRKLESFIALLCGDAVYVFPEKTFRAHNKITCCTSFLSSSMLFLMSEREEKLKWRNMTKKLQARTSFVVYAVAKYEEGKKVNRWKKAEKRNVGSPAIKLNFRNVFSKHIPFVGLRKKCCLVSGVYLTWQAADDNDHRYRKLSALRTIEKQNCYFHRRNIKPETSLLPSMAAVCLLDCCWCIWKSFQHAYVCVCEFTVNVRYTWPK